MTNETEYTSTGGHRWSWHNVSDINQDSYWEVTCKFCNRKMYSASPVHLAQMMAHDPNPCTMPLGTNELKLLKQVLRAKL